MVQAMVKHQGPVYIRINRNDLPVFTPEEGEYEIGKMTRVVEGSDVVMFATGAMVWKSWEAAQQLKSDGILAEVINVSTLKPLRKAEVLRHAAGKKAIVVVEEATKIGGLGSAIALAIAGELYVPFRHLGIDDQFGISAHSYAELLEHFGLTERHIAQTVRQALGK